MSTIYRGSRAAKTMPENDKRPKGSLNRTSEKVSGVMEKPYTSSIHSGGSNITVAVRCRGRNAREIKARSGVVVDTSSGTEVSVRVGAAASSSLKTYKVDRVFGSDADQEIVFDEIASPIVDDFMSGMNCTIFAYGQTGTGKTYTMCGDDTLNQETHSYEAGIIPRVIFKVFNELNLKGYKDNVVSCSFVELYNEDLRDLLDEDNTKKVRIFDDSKKAVSVQGLSNNYADSAVAALRLLQCGLRKRHVAATSMNDYSSRSHTIFTIRLMYDPEGTGNMVQKAKINLVDLAGSENIGKSGAENKRAREAGVINQSLLTLGRVINSLVEKSSHIPYRESKLTRLLQDSLGGRTKTCIIAAISPALINIEETLSTLEYASKAKSIKNKPQVNALMSKATTMRELGSEVEKMRLDLNATRAKNGIYMDEKNHNELMAEQESQRLLIRDQQRKLDTLESQLKAQRDKAESNRMVLVDRTKALEMKEEELRVEKAAHGKTENELQSVNLNLVQSIKRLQEDNEKLRLSVEDKMKLQQTVADELKKHVTGAETISHGLKSRMNEFDKIQKVFINEFITKVQEAFDTERQELEYVQRTIRSSRVEHDKVVQSLRENLNTSNEKPVSTIEKSFDEIEKYASTLSSEYERILPQLCQMFEKECKQGFDLMNQKVNEFLNGLKKDSSKAQKYLETSITESKTLSSKIIEGTQKVARDQVIVMNKISVLIGSQYDKRQAEDAEMLAAVKTMLEARGKSYHTDTQELQSIISSNLAGIQQSSSDSIDKYKGHSDVIAKQNGELQQYLVKCSELSQQVGTELRKVEENVTKSTLKDMEAMRLDHDSKVNKVSKLFEEVKMARDGLSEISRLHKGRNTQLSDNITNLTSHTERLESTIINHLEKTKAFDTNGIPIQSEMVNKAWQGMESGTMVDVKCIDEMVHQLNKSLECLGAGSDAKTQPPQPPQSPQRSNSLEAATPLMPTSKNHENIRPKSETRKRKTPETPSSTRRTRSKYMI